MPFGDRALLVEVDAAPGPRGGGAAALDAVLALRRRLAASRPDGVVDLVPAARTVLVRVDPAVLPLSAARAWVAAQASATGPGAASRAPREVQLPVVYDGPDLAATAALLGVDAAALVRRHTATSWTVAFTGFAPGFGYLVGDDWPFDVPRLAAPRTSVPAGAVALAGGFTGVYPRATPGGWRLIGTTDAVLFDPDAADPALLAPGATVRFLEAPARPVPVEPARVQRVDGGRTRPLGDPLHPRGEGGGFEVLEPGLRTTVQDLGRPGRAAEGIAVSGALDRAALRAGNRLVGNAEDAAGLEITMGGLRAVARRGLWIAVTGGWGPVRIAGRDVGPWQAMPWPAGALLEVDWLDRGARAYLAVRGGVDARAVAGSRATDTLAGLGPAPLRAGDVVAVGDAAVAPIPPAEPVMAIPPPEDLEIPLAAGPRGDWFTATARAALFDAVWTVTDHADRVGIRLDGPVLDRARDDELPSEPMTPGAVQVPPEGRPVILMADGPVTGGYPVAAVVTDAALDLLAQARPGTRIRFRHARPA
nr:urea amidolyase family protein [Microbacterium sp. SYP-A9085]